MVKKKIYESTLIQVVYIKYSFEKYPQLFTFAIVQHHR